MEKTKEMIEIKFLRDGNPKDGDREGHWAILDMSKAEKIAEKICREHGVKLSEMDIASYEYHPHGFTMLNTITLPHNDDMATVKRAIAKKGQVTKTFLYFHGESGAEVITLDARKALLPHIAKHKKAKAQMAKLIAKAKKTGEPQLVEKYMDECGESDCSQDAVSHYIDGCGKISVRRLHTY